MRRIVTFSAVLMATTSLPARALEFGNGFTATGEFELEYFDSSGGGSGETLGYATADIGYQQPAGGFGGFIGFDAFAIDGDQEIALYGALSYSGGFGKLQFGVPRPANDDYLDTPNLGGLRYYELLFGNFANSAVTREYLLADTDVPVGLRYDGVFGATKVGASYHRIEDTDVFDIAANHQIGNTVLRAGIEHLSGSGNDATTFSLGAEAAFGPVNAGVLFTDASDITGQRAAQLYAVYSPISNLNLTGTYWAVNGGSGTNSIYGLAADYTFSQGAYVEGGIADGDGTDAIYNVSLGLKF
jgi:hypothetical protein